MIWRRGNGRYYPKESRRIIEWRKPYACLLRKLHHWSRMYHAGLMSGMGDIVTEHGISSIRIDYEAIGRAAGEILAAGQHRIVGHATQLMPGQTT